MISPRCCSKVDAATVFFPIAVTYRIGPFSTAEFLRRLPIIHILIIIVQIIIIHAPADIVSAVMANVVIIIIAMRGRATLLSLIVGFSVFGTGALLGIIHSLYFTGRV